MFLKFIGLLNVFKYGSSYLCSNEIVSLHITPSNNKALLAYAYISPQWTKGTGKYCVISIWIYVNKLLLTYSDNIIIYNHNRICQANNYIRACICNDHIRRSFYGCLDSNIDLEYFKSYDLNERNKKK